MEITSGFKRNDILLPPMDSSVLAALNTLSPHHKCRKDSVLKVKRNTQKHTPALELTDTNVSETRLLLNQTSELFSHQFHMRNRRIDI